MMDESKSPANSENNPGKMRDSGLGSECFTAPLNTSGTDLFSLQIDDVSGSQKDCVEDVIITSESSYASTTPLSTGQTTGEVFKFESHSFPPKSHGTSELFDRRNRRSFKTVLQAVDTFIPVGKQRHANFTPPRLSPQTLSDSEELYSLHGRRSSACELLRTKDREKEIGVDLRLVSDHFNVQCVGLGTGYHLQNHPHSVYNNKIYSSSYPGSPSTPDVHRDSIKGMKVSKGSSRCAFGTFC